MYSRKILCGPVCGACTIKHTPHTAFLPFIAAALFLLASCYPFNLSLKLRPLSLSLGDYTRGFIITYKDGNSAGPFLPGDTVLTTGKTIKSITPVGKPPILIGRPDTDTINLNIDALLGTLDFRPADGDGYIPIGSYAEFQMINTDPTTRAGTYRLEADLDLMGEDWTLVGNWSPVDLDAGGIFDGNGKSIHNLFVNNSTAGLFGSVASTSKVENVHIRSGGVTGPVSSTVGGIVGSNNGTINACSNAATVTGPVAGGIVGSNNATITDCYNTGEVSGTGTGSNVGGVAGTNAGNITTACYNTGEVFGDGNIGGVVGTNYRTITACYNTGVVSGTGTGSNVGGVAGTNDNNLFFLTACYNTGAVSGTGNVGGVAGENTGNITACYNTDTISGGGVLGGVAGENHATITACYNTGAVSGNGGLGGVAGQSGGAGEITACYNTGAVSGVGNIGGVLGNGAAAVTSNYWLDGVGAANFGIGDPSGNVNATPFGSGPTEWPTTSTHTQWGIGASDGSSGNYWKSLGSYGGAFPRLWYE